MKIIKNSLVLLASMVLLSGNAQEVATDAKKNVLRLENKKGPANSIDLSHWKVTLPVGNPKLIEVEDLDRIDYTNNPELKDFMYTDSSDGSLVFYAYPSMTTKNTKYSRCELREQMVPSDDNINWTFKEGGRMRATIAIDEISKNKKGKYDKVIVMQIHGRLSKEQREELGKDDYDAPPILKVYWNNGKIRLKSKHLIKGKGKFPEVLKKSSWGDDDGYNFPVKVGFDKFTIEVIAKHKYMEVILNGKYSKIYNGKDMKAWGVFDNYFKAGNYLGSKDKGAFAKVKFYELDIKH